MPAAFMICMVKAPDKELLTCSTNLSVVGFGETSRTAAEVSVTEVELFNFVKAAEVLTSTNQLIFQPTAEEDWILMVCVPAGRLMVALVVCQFWKPPVTGTFTVASTVPALFFTWNWAPE